MWQLTGWKSGVWGFVRINYTTERAIRAAEERFKRSGYTTHTAFVCQ